MEKAGYLGLGQNCTRLELMCVAHKIERGLSVKQGAVHLKKRIDR
jgi:hypothetical protein